MRKPLIRAAIAAALAAGVTGSANSAVIASSTFDASNEGWRTGEFTSLSAGIPSTYNAVEQLITTTDVVGQTSFLAPASYLGNQSAAFGGLFSFDVSDANNDPELYSPLSLIGNGLTLYAERTAGPGTSLTPYSVTLLGANFITSNPFTPGGAAATDAQLLSVLSSLDQVAVYADWNSGEDFTRLDNVVLQSAPGAIPEPSTWMMMIIGFGTIGFALRRRRDRGAASSTWMTTTIRHRVNVAPAIVSGWEGKIMKKWLCLMAATAAALMSSQAAGAAMVIDVSRSFVAGSGGGPSFYELNADFSLPVGFTDPVLNIINLFFDDRGVVLLNGVIVDNGGVFGPGNGNLVLTFDGPNDPFAYTRPNGGRSVVVDSGFLTGLNTLRVVANDTGTGIFGSLRNGADGPSGPTATVFDATVTFDAAAAVPEPSTWAMLILGFGAVGYAMRRRRDAIRSPQAV